MISLSRRIRDRISQQLSHVEPITVSLPNAGGDPSQEAGGHTTPTGQETLFADTNSSNRESVCDVTCHLALRVPGNHQSMPIRVSSQNQRPKQAEKPKFGIWPLCSTVPMCKSDCRSAIAKGLNRSTQNVL